MLARHNGCVGEYGDLPYLLHRVYVIQYKMYFLVHEWLTADDAKLIDFVHLRRQAVDHGVHLRQISVLRMLVILHQVGAVSALHGAFLGNHQVNGLDRQALRGHEVLMVMQAGTNQVLDVFLGILAGVPAAVDAMEVEPSDVEAAQDFAATTPIRVAERGQWLYHVLDVWRSQVERRRPEIFRK